MSIKSEFEASKRELDARLNDRSYGTIRGPGFNLEPIFCLNCGKSGGGVTADVIPNVFYVCQSCVGRCGAPPGAVEVTLESPNVIKE